MTDETRFGEAGRATPPPEHLPRPWWIYRGTGLPRHDVDLASLLPAPPPWRTFGGRPAGRPDEPGAPDTAPEAPAEDAADQFRRLGAWVNGVVPDATEADLVNAALILRRPLLVTGRPGTGKSTLAYRISRELGLGRVLRWPITSRTTLGSGLYTYDAIGRVHAAAVTEKQAAESGVPHGTEPADDGEIGDYLQLGPLGTALLPHRLPRVLLIDEFDKSSMDFPNDLLDVFEAGEFTVPELVRTRRRTPLVRVQTDDPDGSTYVRDGRVRCGEFPMVVITSNGERELPPAFLRRCLQLRMAEPGVEQLADIVAAHLGAAGQDARWRELIGTFAERSEHENGLAADQLLNAIWLASAGARSGEAEWDALLRAVWQRLDGWGPT